MRFFADGVELVLAQEALDLLVAFACGEANLQPGRLRLAGLRPLFEGDDDAVHGHLDRRQRRSGLLLHFEAEDAGEGVGDGVHDGVHVGRAA